MITVFSMLVVVFILRWACKPHRQETWVNLWSNLRSNKRSKRRAVVAAHTEPDVAVIKAAKSKEEDDDTLEPEDRIPVGEIRCRHHSNAGSSSSSAGGSSSTIDCTECKQKPHVVQQLIGGSCMRKDDSAADLQKLPGLRSKAVCEELLAIGRTFYSWGSVSLLTVLCHERQQIKATTVSNCCNLSATCWRTHPDLFGLRP